MRHLDGIPLAIELAAAQSAMRTPEQVLALLDDRFALLAQRLRRVPLRHQTLAATVAWSYDLLDDVEQRAFRRLSACAGPFSRATGARVLELPEPEAAELLESLRSRSLLVPVLEGSEPCGFDLLETLREYGRSMAARPRGAGPLRPGRGDGVAADPGPAR